MTELFVTHDSGHREEFLTGARRDTQDGKPRFDLIPLWLLNMLQFPFSRTWYRPEKYLPIITGFCDESDESYLPPIMKNRVGGLYLRGARKYGMNNYQKGINFARVFASLIRHAFAWFFGDRSEDHLAAVIWNATTLMWEENEIHEGRLPRFLADAGPMADESRCGKP